MRARRREPQAQPSHHPSVNQAEPRLGLQAAASVRYFATPVA